MRWRNGVGRVLVRVTRETVAAAPAASFARRLTVPPWRAPDMELVYGSWFGMFPFRDTEGRQLGEANTVPDVLRDPDVADEWMPCRYEDSRQGRRFNVAALRQVTANWQAVLADVAHVRDALVRSCGWRGPLTPARLMVLAHTMTSIPAFLARRRVRPLRDGALPARFAAACKVCAGVHMASEDMLRRNGPVLQIHRPDELLAMIQARGLFIAPTGNVCGGPIKMVRQLLAAMIDGGPARVPEGVSAVAETSALVDYGLAIAQLELLLLRRLTRVAECVELDEEVPTAADAISGALVDALGVDTIGSAGAARDVRDLPTIERASLAAAGASFAHAMNALGRDVPAIDARALSGRTPSQRRALRRRGLALRVRDGRVQLRRTLPF